jgi:hypothetical protein
MNRYRQTDSIHPSLQIPLLPFVWLTCDPETNPYQDNLKDSPENSNPIPSLQKILFPSYQETYESQY